MLSIKHRGEWLAAAVALVLVVMAGCADFGTGIPTIRNGGGQNGDTATVSFAADVLPIFAANCGGAFCHNPCGANNGGGLCLQSHTTLMQGGVVIPGDSSGSALVQRLDGRLTPRMPYGRAPLADTLIQLVRIWIAEGALDN